MKQHTRWLDRLDLKDEPVPGQPLVELYGNKRVIIENHEGVTEYGNEAIRVKVKYGSVLICGSDLMVYRMCRRQLVICGMIVAVNLDRG